ncbi:hypothetical protein P389DRAFT_176856 [Cystobasidium minutum MCA 4210]|uniref:uncharacterized protein n=1 Tax=Cystobasidium minutum MCA 4210 TaxID=1397322 RepID=UPI0034CE0225|eukprot:jgi/Rhomi1/176856/fgenesh1_pg.1_\
MSKQTDVSIVFEHPVGWEPAPKGFSDDWPYIADGAAKGIPWQWARMPRSTVNTRDCTTTLKYSLTIRTNDADSPLLSAIADEIAKYPTYGTHWGWKQEVKASTSTITVTQVGHVLTLTAVPRKVAVQIEGLFWKPEPSAATKGTRKPSAVTQGTRKPPVMYQATWTTRNNNNHVLCIYRTDASDVSNKVWEVLEREQGKLQLVSCKRVDDRHTEISGKLPAPPPAKLVCNRNSPANAPVGKADARRGKRTGPSWPRARTPIMSNNASTREMSRAIAGYEQTSVTLQPPPPAKLAHDSNTPVDAPVAKVIGKGRKAWYGSHRHCN